MSLREGIRYVSWKQPIRPAALALLSGALLVLAGCVSPASPGASPASSTRTPEPSTSDATGTTTGTTIAGAGANVSREPNVTRPPNATFGKGDQPPGLESRLYDLVVAENRTAHAEARGLRLRNGSVLVVVELRPGSELPSEFDLTVRTRYENLVQVYAPVGDLVPIAEHENVSFVRTPREPAADALSTFPNPCSPTIPSGESSRSASYCS